MTTFTKFSSRCKMRYDFADQIQVRYFHGSGEAFDTWVSGEEALSRLESDAAEERLRGLRRLDWSQLRETGASLPGRAKEWLLDDLARRAADEVRDLAGDNIIGDSLASAVHDEEVDEDPDEAQRRKWTAYLDDSQFRSRVLELAWIQLQGSFPEEPPPQEPDDWA